jgi:16S rRNA C1402 N4-methylase RsmH
MNCRIIHTVTGAIDRLMAGGRICVISFHLWKTGSLRRPTKAKAKLHGPKTFPFAYEARRRRSADYAFAVKADARELLKRKKPQRKAGGCGKNLT